jgi:hypothetical protein
MQDILKTIQSGSVTQDQVSELLSPEDAKNKPTIEAWAVKYNVTFAPKPVKDGAKAEPDDTGVMRDLEVMVN